MGKRKQKTNKQSKKKLLLWVLAALVFVVAALVVAWNVNNYISQVKYEEDRQRFMRVKEDIETLTTELNKVDENIQWESEATCQRSSVKYQEGLAACVADTEAIVAVGSDKEVEELIGVYNEAFRDINQKLDIVSTDEYSPSDYSPSFPKQLKPGAGGQGFWSSNSDMVCGSLFKIRDPYYGAPPSNELEMSFACNDRAEDTWFHVPTFREILDEHGRE